MPHFSSWSWPVEYVGPFDEALDKIEKIERDLKWDEKISKAVWRGTAWFNPDWNMGLRPKLLEVTEGKEWADVQLWGQGQEEKNNTIGIDEFCRYKYIVYAEVCEEYLNWHSMLADLNRRENLTVDDSHSTKLAQVSFLHHHRPTSSTQHISSDLPSPPSSSLQLLPTHSPRPPRPGRSHILLQQRTSSSFVPTGLISKP